MLTSLSTRDAPGIKAKLEKNLLSLRDAAKSTHGFIRSNNYTVSPYQSTRYDSTESAENASSVIISEWNGELDWDAWFTSDTRKHIVQDIEEHLEKRETHLVLSKQEGQVFLL